MSEQTPHLPSWLTCMSDPHPQASLFGGTGDRKMQAGPSEGTCSEMFMETALSEDDDRLFMSPVPALVTLVSLTSD